MFNNSIVNTNILLTKITAAKNEVALSYHKVRGLYFPAVILTATIYPPEHIAYAPYDNQAGLHFARHYFVTIYTVIYTN